MSRKTNFVKLREAKVNKKSYYFFTVPKHLFLEFEDINLNNIFSIVWDDEKKTLTYKLL